MIARIWRGITPAEKADAYLEHLGETGLRAYANVSGCRGVKVLKRVQGEHCEIMLISLWNSMDAVREFAGGKVLVALGCGGDRDPGKRWSMGRLAAEGADVVVVTDDNPRSEDPAMIRQTVLAGVRDAASAAAAEIADRRLAIRTLVNQAEDGDCVLILGKGHEQGQEFEDGRKIPFDDRDVARDELRRLAAGAP